MTRLALLLSLGLGLSAQAAPMRSADIRDASLYLQADRPDSLTAHWVPTWQAEANEERIYWLNGQGKIQGERLIAASETQGSQRQTDLRTDTLSNAGEERWEPNPGKAEDVKRSLAGVTQGTPVQRVDSTGTTCPKAGGSLRYFGADNRTRDAPFNCQDGRVSLDLAGETLFTLSGSAS